MFRTVKELHGHALHATDGVMGKVDQFYFDDRNWAIRYLVADIGSWLTGRKVLISPAALERPLDGELKVKLSREQIRNSPDINTAQPISREHEIALHDYYTWPYYWVFPLSYNSLGGAMYPGLSNPASYMPLVNKQAREAMRKVQDEEENIRKSHLRSSKEITGYMAQGIDEEIGRVDDLIVDDQGWVIRYIVLDVGMFPKHKVIISPQWTKGIDWDDQKIYVDHTREIVRQGPSFDILTVIDRDFETRLFEYYERPKYWNDK